MSMAWTTDTDTWEELLMQRFVRLAFVAAVAMSVSTMARAAAGTEYYQYDARGRLTQVTYPGGSVIAYTYDAAGNRVSSGLPPPPPGQGTFSYVSGSHTNAGASGDTATANIKNTGAVSITGITYSCNGSFHPIGTPPTTLAVGASASYQCQAAASGGYTVTFTFSSSTGTASQYTTPAF